MKPLNGYRPSHRNKWLFIKHGILTVQQLELWEYYADIFDFDKRHSKCGLVEVFFDEIAPIFRCSTNTIRGWHNKLLLLGFIRKTSRKHVFQLVCYERFISPGIWKGKAAEYAEKEKNQPFEIILQSFETNLQTIEENLQQIGKNNKKKSDKTTKPLVIVIGSSNNGYKDSLINIKTDAEYRKIAVSGEFPHLSVDDMKWIDENVREDINTPNQELYE